MEKAPKLAPLKYEFHNNARWAKDGVLQTLNDYICINTNIIPVKAGQVYEYTGLGSWAVCGYWLSSNETPNKNNVVENLVYGNNGNNTTTTFEVPFIPSEEDSSVNKIKYAMFTSYTSVGWTTKLKLEVKLIGPKVLGWHENSVSNENILHGKRYVACGDSFTAGTAQAWDPYPELIAERNNMTLINLAIGGSTLTNTGNDDVHKPFSANRRY
jgi:hypothetical protein